MRLHLRPGRGSGIAAGVIAALLLVPGLAVASTLFASPTVPSAVSAGYSNVSFSASSDGWPLSYEEWLPAGYVSTNPYPLVVYLTGVSTSNQTWVRGGFETQLLDHLVGTAPEAVATHALINNASLDGFILIAPNTRTGAGFFTDSACGGPQQKDLIDAIHSEEARHAIDPTRVYFVGTSAGAQGGISFVIDHPGLVRAVAIAGTSLDLFEEAAYLQSKVAKGLQFASDNLHAIYGLDCGQVPSAENATATQLFLNLSEARFDPQGLRGTPVYAIAGGGDTQTPNNPKIWPYQQVNNTLFTSSCLVASSFGEPANCSTTLAALNQADPTNFTFRYVYEPNAPHGLGELLPGDILSFFEGHAAGGYYSAAGFPAGHILPTPGLNYTPPPPPKYVVQFQETGLAPGSAWGVNFSGTFRGSTSATIAYTAPNGSYNYSVEDVPGYEPLPPGEVSVSGADTTVGVQYESIPTYAVNFNESGLEEGVPWGIESEGSTCWSNESAVTLSWSNGTHLFEVVALPGFIASPSEGEVVVAGTTMIVNITFVPVTFYPVMFNEAGLPNGTTWSLEVGNLSLTSNSTCMEVNLTNGSYEYVVRPLPGFESPLPGEVTVNGSVAVVNLTFTTVRLYPATFVELGLLNGTNWFVVVESSYEETNGSSLVFYLPNGTYLYAVPDVSGFLPVPSGEFEIDGTGVTVNLTYRPIPEFPVAFVSSGLPGESQWGVDFNGTLLETEDTTLAVNVTNGSYPYSVMAPPGFVPSTRGGLVVVSGEPVRLNVTFAPVTYSVTFLETGLRTGTPWNVTVGSSTQGSSLTSIVFLLPNGTFGYRVGPVAGYVTPSAGEVTVAGGAVQVGVTFVKLVTYQVKFQETGLRTGLSWSVTLANTTESATSGKAILFSIPNGTWSYSVGGVAGYTTAKAQGIVTVSGRAVTVSVPFTVMKYTVTFSQTGLPVGTHWKVTIGTVAVSSSGVNLTFSLSNGSYTYSVGAVSGFASPPGGSLLVNGANVGVRLAYLPIINYVVTFTESGLPKGTSWSVVFGGHSHATTGKSVTFSTPNGTYSFSVSATGFVANPRNGSVTVNGSSTGVSLTFTGAMAPNVPGAAGGILLPAKQYSGIRRMV